MSDQGSSRRVYEVVWPWRAPVEEDVKSGLPNYVKAILQASVMLVIAFILYRFFHHRTMSFIVGGMAAVVLLSGLFIPPVFAAIERFGQALGRWVGVGLTWGLLVPFYYVCFVPMHILLKVRGKDPMSRQWPTDRVTYWEPRPPVADVAHYKRQH